MDYKNAATGKRRGGPNQRENDDLQLRSRPLDQARVSGVGTPYRTPGDTAHPAEGGA
jgi:hypothetical protein